MEDAAKAAAAGHSPERTGQDQGRAQPPGFKAQQFQPGQSGNPKGRPPGVPNLNAVLREAALKKRTDGKDWVDALLDRALTDKDPALALKIVDKLFASVTPEAPGLVANNSLEGLLARLQGGTDESPDDDDVHAPALNGGQPS